MLIPLNLILLALLLFSPLYGVALEKPGEELKQVGLSTKLGSQVNLDLTFTNASAETVSLREIAGEKTPFLLVPVYYHCPRLCGLVLSGVRDLLNKLSLRLGGEYRTIIVSFDSSEGAELARTKREKYHKAFGGKGDVETGMHFLVGSETSVSTLMNQIGFNYRPDKGEFAHTAAIMILTPEGKISQYFAGIDFPAWDIKLALVEASRGEIGSVFDQVLLYCFRFDPTKGKYTWAALGLIRVGGALTLLLLGGLVFILWRREKRGREKRGSHKRILNN